MRDFDPTASEFVSSGYLQNSRPGGRHYDPMTVMAGTSLAGSVLGADAADSAASMQAGAARDANALSKEQFNAIRSDLAPYRDIGAGSANMLARLLGIGGGASSDVGALRAELLPQFTSKTPRGSMSDAWLAFDGSDADVANYGGSTNRERVWDDATQQALSVPRGWSGGQSTVDEAGLSAAMAARAGNPESQGQEFGSLLRNFTGEDLQDEPGYKFGLDQGMQALDRRLASGGNYFSGAALKGAQRFGQDYAGTKFGEAFNRDSANKTRTYNFLSGTMGVGQNAAAQTGNAGQTMAQQVGANTTGMANAAGAAQIAGANQWTSGLNNIGGMYRQNQLLDRIIGGNSGWSSKQIADANAWNVPQYAQPLNF